jgi:hypothetical protein
VFVGRWLALAPPRLIFPVLIFPVLMVLPPRLTVMLLLPPPQFVFQWPPFHAAPIAAPHTRPVASAAPGGYG